uniref:Calcyphosin-like protein n=2 Tax=Steinernema glaseri TaxID=37863 RepID=A0A1I7YGF1_9BILA
MINSSACFQTSLGVSILNIAPASMTEHELKQKAEQKLQTVTDPLEKLRYTCLRRGAAGIKELGRSFRIMDDNENRSLDLAEFTKGVHDFGVKIKDSDIKSLFESLDKDKSGSISFDEFLIALRPPMSQARLNLIDKAFQKLDKTGDGVVTVDDMEGVYEHRRHPQFISGEKSKEEIFQQFLRNFEIGGHVDGRVTKEEFVNYYAGISAAIDTDIYFDLMMRNSWKL